MTIDHRTTRLHGGPLAGANARIYRDQGGHEPNTITLCLGAMLPDWRPAGWVTYARQADGTYQWPDPVTEQTPVDPAAVAVAGLSGGPEGSDTSEGAIDALRSLGRAGFKYEDVDPASVMHDTFRPLFDGASPRAHDFDQDRRHTLIRCCAVCGKWPMHHNHTGITTDLCSCDAHRMPPGGDTQ